MAAVPTAAVTVDNRLLDGVADATWPMLEVRRWPAAPGRASSADDDDAAVAAGGAMPLRGVVAVAVDVVLRARGATMARIGCVARIGPCAVPARSPPFGPEAAVAIAAACVRNLSCEIGGMTDAFSSVGGAAAAE